MVHSINQASGCRQIPRKSWLVRLFGQVLQPVIVGANTYLECTVRGWTLNDPKAFTMWSEQQSRSKILITDGLPMI
jgi:hypothetical protein